MYFLYNIAVYIMSFFLNVLAIFNKKLALFTNGRKGVFKQLEKAFDPNHRFIWIHCASLGEFEQARPLIEKLKTNYGENKILLTFFSPSGYEVRKDFEFADLVTYLPLDTKKNAEKFLKLAKPEIAIFVKYEFWPNMLRALKNKNIRTLLISGIFREDQIFFKSYGRWMRKTLAAFDHFFVQNLTSKNLLSQFGFNNSTLSGDTRFDRVDEISKQHNHIEQVAQFAAGFTILVAGSTWDKDHQLLINFINNEACEKQKFIIAPHNINATEIIKLQQQINKRSRLITDVLNKNNAYAQVLIVNNIGLLTKIYSQADLSYVGGGFGAGIHNILEPACFGLPIVIGPEYRKFNEAIELVELKAATVINDQNEFNKILNSLFNNVHLRQEKGKISKDYIQKNVGATEKIIHYLEPFIS